MLYKICLFLCLLPGLVSGQFIFQNLRTNDGLSSKVIRSLYKDKEGFLWIGTAKGLSRYDGAVIKQYNSEVGFKDIFINAIQPFEKEDIIIGTSTGVLIFEKLTGSFRRDSRFAKVDGEEIVTIKLDGHARLWIMTTSEVYIYANNHLFSVEEEIPGAGILHHGEYKMSILIWDFKRKGFWMGGLKTYFIDCSNKAIYHKLNNPFNLPILKESKVFAIAIDRNANLWYGCNTNKSLNFWDRHTGSLKTYFELEAHKPFDGANYLFVDSKDRLWISTWAFAAYLKEPEKRIKKIPYSQDRRYSVGYGFFNDIIEDNEGNVWLGTINGISKAQANEPVQAIYQLPSFEYFLQTGFAHSNTIVINDNKIMASKEDGIIAYDMDRLTYNRYSLTNKTYDLGKNRFTMSQKFGEDWWCAGIDGIFILRKGSKKLEAFTGIKYRGNKKYANFIFADAEGKIWFHIWDDAMYRYDPVSKKMNRFDGTDQLFGEFKYANCQTFLTKRNGNILFSINDTGFLEFDATLQRFITIPEKKPENFKAYRLVEDNLRNVWAVVWGRGVLKLDNHNKLVDSLNTSNGFPYDHLSSIAFDHLGNIWVGGSEGLLFFNPISKDITQVYVDLGQNLQDYWNDLYVANNKIYAAMLDHVVVLDPSKFAALKVREPPHITSVKIFGKEKEDFRKNPQLDLAHDEDYLTFQFASLVHRDVPTLRYSYMLEGFDQTWINSGRSLVASYKNLPWGKYKFKVRSTDERGNWMSVEKTLIINIRPPWWRESWFLGAITILFFALLINLYYVYLKRKRKRIMDASIDYFANAVYPENSVKEICWDIAYNCVLHLHLQDCVVYLMDHKRNVLVQKAAYTYNSPKTYEQDSPTEIPVGKGIIGTVAKTGKHLVIRNTSRDPRYVVIEQRRFSELSVPILHDGKVIGVVDSEHYKKNYFKSEHLKAMSIIASICSGKIAEAIAQAAAKEKEIELLEISKALAESQLMALRAQMNPHFVFNCLNSIQECIVSEKFKEASKYLNLFAKLFRNLLNNSGRSLITIDEERDILEFYLQLEEMRFSNSFSYEIRFDEELEDEGIMIPSLLVQPYVENALWHGLMHSELERKLLVEFKKINEDIFECRIDDNGIGRKKSFELRAINEKNRYHESKGLGISSDRLSVLNRQGHHAEVEFVDKVHDNGDAAGTLVIVRLSTYLR
ncbi:histidine kinase [Dyadobacter sp. CY327]|uniref:histidine kinase n=1 Tax=Dyadobacter sp. CY327 TaxID=2907301 RepID=UPI001F178F27|nr:histidine kinase [Dyadobacter sp. CY327]MCE7073296.1 histidine kinase [Dyadobacter sp. CY327]